MLPTSSGAARTNPLSSREVTKFLGHNTNFLTIGSNCKYPNSRANTVITQTIGYYYKCPKIKGKIEFLQLSRI